MKRIWKLLTPLLLVISVVPAQAVQRGRNLLVNPGFETDGGWSSVGSGFEIDHTVAHSGKRSLKCSGAALDSIHGAMQVITFDKPVRHPILISGWSKSQGAEVGRDYDIYLDVHYADGTPLWGQIAHFEPGSHDWQRTELIFDVQKPVRSIEVFMLFRQAKGTVWFDDITVELAPFQFRGLRLLPGLYGGRSLDVTGNATLPAAWTATLSGPSSDRNVRGELASSHGKQLPIRLTWLDKKAESGRESDLHLSITATDDLLGESIHEEKTVAVNGSQPQRGYAVWTETSMRRVWPYSLPEESHASETAAITLAGNEYESFQIALLPAPGTELRHVKLVASDLVRAGGAGRISAANVQWKQVGYVKVDKLRHIPAYPDASPGWWPDPLLPVPEFNVPSGFTQSVWVTAYAPAGTPPGTYTGTVRIVPDNAPAATVSVRAQVYGFTLPVESHMKTAFALMDGFLEKVYGKPLTPALRQAYGDYLLRHRINPDDISRTAPPAIADLDHYKAEGLNAFNVLNLVPERGNRTWVCWSPLEIYTPAFKQHLIDRLDPYVAQLRQHGLANKAYIYCFDERGKDFYPTIREYFGMVKQRYPEIHTLTTAKVPQDPAVMRDLNVDWNCPLTPVYNLEQADKCRAAGQQVWAYICMGPGYPYANWLADNPLIEARVIWWQAYQQKMDGFLYWGLNIWDRPHNDKPIDPAHGPLLDWSITTGGKFDFLHGDGRLIYAGPNGPIGSIRMENIRDGLEDYEYLWLLSRKAGSVEAGRRACLPVTDSLTHFTRDPQRLLQQRDVIARQIETNGGKSGNGAP